MLWKEAFAILEKGKPVVRDSWPATKGYFLILPGAQYAYAVANAFAAPSVLLAMITRDDFNADDWRETTDAEVTELLKPKPLPEDEEDTEDHIKQAA